MKSSTKEGLQAIGLALLYLIVAVGVPISAFIIIRPHVDSALVAIREAREPITVEELYYNGTLGMVAYHNGWLGFGGISETVLTFTDGIAYTFSGELQVTVGLNYTVHYRVTTYANTRARTEMVGVVWRS